MFSHSIRPPEPAAQSAGSLCAEPKKVLDPATPPPPMTPQTPSTPGVKEIVNLDNLYKVNVDVLKNLTWTWIVQKSWGLTFWLLCYIIACEVEFEILQNSPENQKILSCVVGLGGIAYTAAGCTALEPIASIALAVAISCWRPFELTWPLIVVTIIMLVILQIPPLIVVGSACRRVADRTQRPLREILPYGLAHFALHTLGLAPNSVGAESDSTLLETQKWCSLGTLAATVLFTPAFNVDGTEPATHGPEIALVAPIYFGILIFCSMKFELFHSAEFLGLSGIYTGIVYMHGAENHPTPEIGAWILAFALVFYVLSRLFHTGYVVLIMRQLDHAVSLASNRCTPNSGTHSRTNSDSLRV